MRGHHEARLPVAISSVDGRSAAKQLAEGVLEGRVAAERAGTGGFGYDPVFVPAGESETVAELGDGWKAANSHRARAARALAARLGAHAGTV